MPDGLDTALQSSYSELQELASQLLRRHRFGPTPRQTSLVHEAYLRLASGGQPGFRDRGHFLATAARAMRFVLVDQARRRSALKRGQGRTPLAIEETSPSQLSADLDLLAVDEALDRLHKVFPRKAALVELRFFGGLSNDEIAARLGISRATVKRDWQLARAWLHRSIHGRAG